MLPLPILKTSFDLFWLTHEGFCLDSCQERGNLTCRRFLWRVSSCLRREGTGPRKHWIDSRQVHEHFRPSLYAFKKQLHHFTLSLYCRGQRATGILCRQKSARLWRYWSMLFSSAVSWRCSVALMNRQKWLCKPRSTTVTVNAFKSQSFQCRFFQLMKTKSRFSVIIFEDWDEPHKYGPRTLSGSSALKQRSDFPWLFPFS